MDITASMIRCYKSCPKKYFFEYVEQLKPVETQPALEIGSSYHECVGDLLMGHKHEITDLASVMADAFDRFIPWRGWAIKDVEKEFRVQIARGVYLRGKIDALCSDGEPVEHKSSSTKPDEKYMRRLFLDDQVSCYLLALTIQRGMPVNRIIYTVCTKPALKPAAKLVIDPECQQAELMTRQMAWYDNDKIKCFEVTRSPMEIAAFQEEVTYLARSIMSRKIWYRNPQACSIMGCPYLPICQDYDPELMCGFVKKERKSEELS